jgi:hypothetical protein
MKKIVLTMVAMLSMTMAFAGNTESDSKVKTAEDGLATEANYNMAVSYYSLSQALGLYGDQIQLVEYIHDRFVNEVNKAGKADASLRKELVSKAATKELQAMRQVLDKEQFRKYNTLLNVTLNNRGLLR